MTDTISDDRYRLIHILVVHFDMFRDKAEDAADLFLHHKTLASRHQEPVNEPIVTEALLHGVSDSLRAAIFEYEDRGLYPGARKVMQAQLDALTASLQKQESVE